MVCPQCIRVEREELAGLGLAVPHVAPGEADVVAPESTEPDYAAIQAVLAGAARGPHQNAAGGLHTLPVAGAAPAELFRLFGVAPRERLPPSLAPVLGLRGAYH